ncbi:MAG: DNA-processing protein DprA, partial [Bacteroidales bacterium]|nr:DNA-processing protein DprA [Bacteroidales bacterium]
MALTMIPKIGAITARKLIEYIGSPEGVFMEKPAHLRTIPGVGEYLAAQVSVKNYLSKAEEEIKQMEKRGISPVYYQDEAYPWRLENCADAPILLFYRGKPGFNGAKYLSVVGTRNATSYGREMCEVIISQLAAQYSDLVIISGLAYGIDVMAHRFALKYGLDTWGVLAHGLHTLYPSSHTDVAGRIMKQGALLSDFPTTVKPERNNFLRRNRIIAGLSEATLVVESGPKGGALITAELAASYNREVFAVPGRIGDTYSSGCNRLIQNNIAALIESGSDIEKLLGWEQEVAQRTEPQNIITEELTEAEQLILRAINEEPG